ncbi:MAG: NAD(P)-binding domain-containing protein [Planctomycetales bacterium]|nr:NAD(P)-binding domain-containing protein [Planctomycetales bacterium]
MAPRKVGVIGTGSVCEALADGFLRHGWEVMRGSREPGKLADWKRKSGAKASAGDFAATARFGPLVVLAVKGTAAESAVKLAGPENLAGKTVLDTTNPIADAPPVNGVLQYFTGPNESLMERSQKAAPRANFVKCFSCVGSALMVDPALPGGKPTMFLCGANAKAKAEAQALLAEFGWESEDLGGPEAARAIEPLAMLWCIPGFVKNDWVHAFKMLRP